MAKWINHVAIAAPRNGTSSHTASPSSGAVVAGELFTPTAGNFLLCLCEGAVTSGSTTGVPANPPSGWSAPDDNQAVNFTGLYLWYKDSAAGSDTVTVNHNGSNYPVVFDFYEFPAATTLDGCASATGVTNGAAGPTLSMSAGTKLIMAAAAADFSSTTGTRTFTWGSSAVESTDTAAPKSGTDGYQFGVAYLEDSTATSQSIAATASAYDGNNSFERLIWSLTVAESGGETHSGGSSAAVTISSSGAGVKLAKAGSSTTVVTSSTGAGSKHSQGGSAASVSASASASGHKLSSKGASASVTASSTGSGQKHALGANAAQIVVTASGGGHAAGASQGGSVATVTITSSGSGSKHSSAGSAASVQAGASGGGKAVRSGGSSATVVASAAGQGYTIRFGAGSTTVTIIPTGGGHTLGSSIWHPMPAIPDVVVQPYPTLTVINPGPSLHEASPGLLKVQNIFNTQEEEVYAGNGAPTVTAGIRLRAKYIDVDSGDLYEWQANMQWVWVGNVKGPKGDAGDTVLSDQDMDALVADVLTDLEPTVDLTVLFENGLAG